MKPFQNLTDAEILGLNNEELNDSIRIGAIERGIKPPITLSEALVSSEWCGYQRPPESAAVWEITPGYYSSRSGVAYLSEEQASKALEGAVHLKDTYRNGETVKTIAVGEFAVQKVLVSRLPNESKAAKFTAYMDSEEDEKAFNTFRDECLERFSSVRQADYDRKVRTERRAEYLRLAQGNEEIARDFWLKAERTEWPGEQGRVADF